MATSQQVTAFFQEMGRLCVSEANRLIGLDKPFVRPSVAMAQAALETGYGTSSLMTKANAYFGIKAGTSWTGKVYSASTNEVYNGVTEVTTATFRAYDTKYESVADYYSLILNSSRYAEALSYYPSAILSPYATIYAIWDGGYATDPDYVGKVMKIIENNKLTTWDAQIDGITTDPSLVPGVDTGYKGDNLGGNIATINPVTSALRTYVLDDLKKKTASNLRLVLEEQKTRN